jgi:hypothetical protein
MNPPCSRSSARASKATGLLIAKIAERLAKEEVNIEYAYLAGSPNAPKGLIVLRLSEIDKGQRALRDI